MAGLPKFAIPPWLLGVSMFTCYLGFVPTALFCSYNEYIFYTMTCFSFAVCLLECVCLVEKHGRKEEREGHGATMLLILQDVTELLKILCTTLVPVMMLTWGGGSFAFVVKVHRSAVGCNVHDLGRLGQEGYMSFFCTNGHVGLDIQESTDCWNETIARRRLRMAHHSHAVHHAVHHGKHGGGNESGAAWKPYETRKGWVAPIFESKKAFEEGKAPPVAWAVKAGQPVAIAQCEMFPRGTCGMWAVPLYNIWRGFEATPHFGEGWGFNITHFQDTEMKNGAMRVRAKHPRADWGEEPGGLSQPFVIAEDWGEYFGYAVPLCWVSCALLAVGFIDRLAQLANFKSLKPLREDSMRDQKYNSMPIIHESALEVEEERGYLAEMMHMWNNPLNTSGGAGTLGLYVPEAAPNGQQFSRALSRGSNGMSSGIHANGDIPGLHPTLHESVANGEINGLHSYI